MFKNLKFKNCFKIYNLKFKINAGFTLVETAVVISVMALIITIASGLFLTSLSSSAKADISQQVRQNGNYALSVMENMIKNSVQVVEVSDVGDSITIANHDGGQTIFQCTSDFRIASASGATTLYLTNTGIIIEHCTFGMPATVGEPPLVTIEFDATKGTRGGRSADFSAIHFESKVNVRNY